MVKGGGLYNKFPKPEIDVIFRGIFYYLPSISLNFFYMHIYGLHEDELGEVMEQNNEEKA